MKVKMFYVGVIVVIAVIVVGAVFLRRLSQNQNLQSTPVSSSQSKSAAEQFTGFSLSDYSGKTVSSNQFQGKPLIINSWASWCPFCRAELPALAEAQDQLKDKVVIVAIDRGESLAVAKQYSDSQGTTGRLVFLLDPQDSFYKSIGGFSMPETIFVDKNGNIQYHKRGPMEKEEILQRTQALISQP